MQNSWNVIKRDLEENLLCDSLKRRVRYTMKSDNKNIVYIKVDGIERKIEVVKDKKIMLPDDQNIMDEFGIHSAYMLKAIKEYKGSNLNNSLYARNPLVRMLAVLDRRVTPKLLEKLALVLDEQPEWLKSFYKLRFDTENIAYVEKIITADDNAEAGSLAEAVEA